MQILFENAHTRNKELAKEIYRYYYFQRKMYVFSYILLGLAFIASLVPAFFGDTLSLMVIILAPLVAMIPLYSYFVQVKAMVSRDKEIYGKEIEVNTVVTESFIQITASTGAVNKIDFDNVKGVIQTKNLILLRTKANLICTFRKDTFTVGTKEEFVLFLKNKGIKVSGK